MTVKIHSLLVFKWENSLYAIEKKKGKKYTEDRIVLVYFLTLELIGSPKPVGSFLFYHSRDQAPYLK